MKKLKMKKSVIAERLPAPKTATTENNEYR